MHFFPILFSAIGRLSPHAQPVIRGVLLDHDGSHHKEESKYNVHALELTLFRAIFQAPL
jgi:hypothetical protein